MSTYDEIVRRTPDWMYAQNRSLVAEMPTIIAQAHEQLVNLLDHDLFRTVITGKKLEASNNGIIDLSAETPRVFEVRALRIKYREGDSFTPIQRRDLEMLTMLYARNAPKRPLYYAEYSGPLVLKVFPAPREDYDLEITANVEPPVLTSENQSNIITREAFRAMERATFRQAALYMRDWQAAAEFEKEMGTALTEVNAQISRRRRDETGQRQIEATNVQGA